MTTPSVVAADHLASHAADGLVATRRITLRRVCLPLRRHHRTAHGDEAVRDVLVLAVEDGDGVVGWGECPSLTAPGYSPETTEVAWAIARDVVLPDLAAVAGRAGGDVPFRADVPMLSSAVEGALIDLALHRAGTSLRDVLGVPDGPGSLRRGPVSLRRGVVLADVADAADVRRDVAAAGASGAALVKLKVTPRTDPELVAEACRAAAPTMGVAIDANGSLADASGLLAALDDLGLAYIEQPWSPAHPEAAGALVGGLRTPVAVDEGARTAAAAVDAVESGAARIVNVKPACLGGVVRALRLVAAVRDAGGDVFVGGMLETGVGRAVAVAFASHVAATHVDPAGSDGAPIPTDLGPSAQYFDVDLTEPIVLDAAGSLVVPAGVGIGVSPDSGRLDAATVEIVEFVAG